MNHQFKPGHNDLCAICDYDEDAHGPNATCESCDAIGNCEILNGILMCATCYQHDKDLEDLSKSVASDKDNRITQLKQKYEREIPSDRRLYFVSRITSIVDIEEDINSMELSTEEKRYALAETIEANITKWKATITGLHEKIREGQGEIIADQRYLNDLVPQLRAEERENFKSYDITYQPQAVVKTTNAGVSKPRMSASDRALESMAKTLGITVEAYKRSLENSLKNVLSIKCTCQETPGVCRIHVS